MNVRELDTPAIVVDLDQLERNIAEMAERVGAAGARVRPHTKTHKTPEVAQLQLRHGAGGLTVAKLGEAEVLADAGFDDVLIANELIGEQKARRLAQLARRIAVRSCVDSLAGARMLSEVAVESGLRFEVLLDINTGLNRSGVLPEDAAELGAAIGALPGLALVGVFSYAGAAPGAPDPGARRDWAVREAELAVGVARELQAKGFPATIVSVGGTSAAPFAAAVEGVSEVRPGTYVFNDVGYSRLGIGSLDQCALRIRSRVISRPAPDRAVIDAGSKVLTTEKRVLGGEDPGFGYIEALPGTQITNLWEEHGVLKLDEDGRQLAVGDVIEIIPNHVCPTINLADSWFGARGAEVEREFAVAARGKTR
jgi:D-serine deaminase-like pyridoxal phosphate-dependent protein